MDERIPFQLEQDATATRLADVARHAKLLKHVKARIPADERVIFVGLYTENGCMNCLFVLPAIAFGLAGLGGLGNQTINTGVAIILFATALASILGAWLVKRRYPAMNCLSVVVLTDKAARTCTCGSGYAITEYPGRFLRWQDAKAVVIGWGNRGKRNCKARATPVVLYEHAGYGGRHFRFAAEPATFKRVVESILHATNPVAAAARQYREKVSGGEKVDAGMACEWPKPWFLPGWKKKACKAAGFLALTLIAAAIEYQLFTVSRGGVASLAIATMIVIIAISGIITSSIAAQMVHDVLAFKVAPRRFGPVPGTAIEARSEGIAWSGVVGPAFLPYSEHMVIEPRWASKKRGFVLVCSIGNGPRAVRLGPVADPWALYYTIGEQLDAWLSRRGYFIDVTELAETTTGSGRIEASIAAIMQSTAQGVIPAELKIKKKARVDAVAVLEAMAVPRARPLACFATVLHRPLAIYADFLDSGELVHLVAPKVYSAGNTCYVEVVATTRRLLVSDVSGTWTRWMQYSRMSHVTAAVKGWKAMKHVKMTIHVKPTEPRSPEGRAWASIGANELNGIMKLAKIPLDAPLIAVIAGVARVPVLPS